MWPEVTVRARNQEEVECLLAALAEAGISCLLQPGFRVEVGGARRAEILRAIRGCLTRNEIDCVEVLLGADEYVLYRQD